MTATFTTSQLRGDRVLVQGTDKNNIVSETVLDSTQWNEIKSHADYHLAEAGFNDAVEAHFADITAAAEAFAAAVAPKKLDPIEYFEIKPAVEGVPAEQGVAHKLNRDSVILRLIEDGNFDRLVWVNNELEVLAA